MESKCLLVVVLRLSWVKAGVDRLGSGVPIEGGKIRLWSFGVLEGEGEKEEKDEEDGCSRWSRSTERPRKVQSTESGEEVGTGELYLCSSNNNNGGRSGSSIWRLGTGK